MPNDFSKLSKSVALYIILVYTESLSNATSQNSHKMAVSSAREDNYEKDSNSKTVVNSELLIFFIVFSCCLVRLARSALSSISMYPCSIREQAIALI